jgi:hypothetical protein
MRYNVAERIFTDVSGCFKHHNVTVFEMPKDEAYRCKQKVHLLGGINGSGECPGCKKSFAVQVLRTDVTKYESGKTRYAQDAFPYLSPEHRELLISGFCPECWEKIFNR